MTPAAGSLRDPDEGQRAALRRAVATWAAQASGGSSGGAVTAAGPGEIELVDVVLLRDGRPGILDVVARVAGRLAHAVLGLHRAGDELHVIGSVDEPVVGRVEDDHGPAWAVDALHDADVAPLLLGAVGGPSYEGPVRLDRDSCPPAGPSLTVSVAEDERDPVLSFGDRCTLRVFSWPRHRRHPGVAFLLALDREGFNHLLAPMVAWRRQGRDLGIVQEGHVGAAPGWSVAMGSLRDLCASGGRPEEAGGDFAAEARALGTMVARMHLALDRAYGRQVGDPAVRADAEAEPLPSLRVHGDLHLGRTARTDQGWVLVDCTPGGARDGAPEYRSPLADVADVLWSLHHAASTVATELARDPMGHPAAGELARAWEERNRRALVDGYLTALGVAGLVPPDPGAVRALLTAFERERDARIAARQAAAF